MPRIGVCDPAASRAMRSMVPSPPKTIRRSTSRTRLATSGEAGPLKPASRAVATSQTAWREAAWISAAAFSTRLRHESLAVLATKPIRAIFLASFFNPHQKFLIARRPQQRRFHQPAPAQCALSRDKFLNLAQHPRMDRGVADHARPAVRLRLARFELRFDERDDTTARAE